MKKTLSLLSTLANTAFGMLLFFDGLLIAKIAYEFATHGKTGVKGWIAHIGLEGRIASESRGPDTVTITSPPGGLVFREFLIMCAVLLALTPLSFWVGRMFAKKARQTT